MSRCARPRAPARRTDAATAKAFDDRLGALATGDSDFDRFVSTCILILLSDAGIRTLLADPARMLAARYLS